MARRKFRLERGFTVGPWSLPGVLEERNPEQLYYALKAGKYHRQPPAGYDNYPEHMEVEVDDQEDPWEVLKGARSLLLREFPKLAPFTTNLVPVFAFDPPIQVDVAAISERLVLYIGPGFFVLDEWGKALVLLHEIEHPRRDHLKRKRKIPNCDHDVWNEAADYFINADIDGWFPGKFPRVIYGPTPDPTLGTPNYAVLDEDSKKRVNRPAGFRDGIIGRIRDTMNKAAGSGRGSIEQLPKESGSGFDVPWQELFEAVHAGLHWEREYSLSKAPRRETDILGKRWFGPQVGLVLDTSGSVSDPVLAKALATIKEAAAVAGGEVLCHMTDVWEEGTEPELIGYYLPERGQKGGGTEFAGALVDLASRGCDVVVVITDGETNDWPKKGWDAGVKSICVTTRTDPPEGRFKRVIRVEDPYSCRP